MTREEFYNGYDFAVFGLPYDLYYNPENQLLICLVAEKQVHKSFVEFDDSEYGFTALLPAFGTVQTINIKFSVCELKT